MSDNDNDNDNDNEPLDIEYDNPDDRRFNKEIKASSGTKTIKKRRDVRPRLMDALWNGLTIYAHRQGKTLDEVMADQLEQDFNKTVTTFSKIMPRQVQHEGSVDTGITVQLLQFDVNSRSAIEFDDNSAKRIPDKSEVSASDKLRLLLDKKRKSTVHIDEDTNEDEPDA